MSTYATDTFAGDGSTVEFTLTFKYISRDHVEVFRVVNSDGAETKLSVITTGTPTGDEYIWESDSKIKVGTAPTSAQTLKIQRDTPEDAQIVQWSDGSYLIAEDLNDSDLQWLYNLQELEDKFASLQTTAIKYLGGIDLTTDVAPSSPTGGDFYINTGSGTVLASWTGIAGDAVVGSEQVVYNSVAMEWEIFKVPSSQTGVLEVKVKDSITRDITDTQRPIIGIQASSSTQDGSMSKEDKAKLDSIDTSAGGIITDAPNDGKQYCRESQAWAQVDIPPGTIIQATAPTSADKGQLWFNTTDNRLYIATDDTPTWVETSPVVAPMTVGASAPSSPAQGTLWYDTNTGRAYVYIDGTTKAWVDQNPGGGGGTTKGGGQNLVFQENEMVCTADYQLTAGRSALSAGPITINNGVTITIPNNQNWVIL